MIKVAKFSKIIFMAVLAFFATITLAKAECQSELDPVVLRIDPQTHAGSLVIMERRGYLRPLMHDCYIAPRLFDSRILNLGVVNYKPSAAFNTEIEKVDHVGVQIVRQNILPYEQADVFSIYRNPNWIRDEKELPPLESPLRTNLESWNRIHTAETIELADADATLGQQWHAAPAPNSWSSWDSRNLWPVQSQMQENSQLVVNNQLLRFRVNPEASHQSIIPFHATIFPSTEIIDVRYYIGSDQVGRRVRFCKQAC
jgi:hypothetical protein